MHGSISGDKQGCHRVYVGRRWSIKEREISRRVRMQHIRVYYCICYHTQHRVSILGVYCEHLPTYARTRDTDTDSNNHMDELIEIVTGYFGVWVSGGRREGGRSTAGKAECVYYYCCYCPSYTILASFLLLFHPHHHHHRDPAAGPPFLFALLSPDCKARLTQQNGPAAAA